MTEKRYYIVYKTTCLKNGKYYIGCHATDDLNDGYLGSGVELKKDIARFGKSAFVREILYECSTHEEAALKEREFANRDVVNDPNSYNKYLGGGVSGVKLGRRSKEARKHGNERITERRKERYHEDPIYRARQIKRSNERQRKKYQSDPVYRAYQRERGRKKYRRKKFRELMKSTEFRSAFVLRCKANENILKKTLELFKHDADFCSLLKTLVENE